MPPSLSRSSLSSLTRCKPTISLPSRTFTTSSSLLSIGPENPRFVEIPLPPQRYQIPPRDIKGKLPVPRNLFPKSARDKTSPAYLASVTPEPSAHHQISEPRNDYIAWKRRMAASRRGNLREGLLELNKRKVKQDAAVANQSAFKRRERERRIRAPQREDERLTSPTIVERTRKPQLGAIPDPNREVRLAEKAGRVQAKEAMKAERRRDSLHTLYMHARKFITTEEELDAEIQKIFVEHPFGQAHPDKTSIWDALGAPPTVQDMLSEVNNSQRSAVSFHAGPAAITGKRMKKIAEELTGGKMD